jgi:hypothetical protein
VNETYLELYNSYGNNIPYTINQAFYAELDNELISELNLDLMHSINEFYNKYL